MSRHLATLALLLSALGCGSPERDGEQPEGEPRLVERAYPYQLGDATICAEYVIDDGAARQYEFYKLEAIRGELAADPALRGYIERSVGLQRVDSCESARLYVSARQTYEESRPSVDQPAQVAAPVELLEPGEADKVTGVDAEFAPVVHLWTIGCSGFLIGPRHIVTAAHCRPSSGRFSLSFVVKVNGDFSAVTPCGLGANSKFVQAQGFVGSGDWVNDFAVIEADCDFPAPADSSDVWVRLALTSAWPEEFISPMGWGRNAHDGSGGGTLRRGEHGIYVSQSSRYLFTSVAERGRARICRGDSGGPALNFTSIPGAPVVMGINLYHTGGSEYCPYPGDVMGFNQMALKTTWIAESFTFGCSTFGSVDGTFRYWRCW